MDKKAHSRHYPVRPTGRRKYDDAAMNAPCGRALTIGGTPYPVVLPTLRDPRLHLAAVIVSLHVLGQVAFDFRVSVAQILISLGTCAVLETAIAFARQRVILWPASALITGNGVAFVLRLPGTQHGDWWSLHGWWIYAATAAVSLLSKHLIRPWNLAGAASRPRGHVFNPSNIGLVLCFLILGSGRAEPLDFWWGPMSSWMVVALVIIVGGGLAILSRLRLLWVAIAFWLSFAAGIAVLALSGHSMTARWHLGPITGGYFWWVLVTSPEILVFLFFMLTDPRTIPASPRMRVAYAVSVGLLASLLIAPARTEFWSKVAVLGALAIVCGAWPVLKRRAPRISPSRTRLAVLGAGVLGLYAGALVAAGIPARPASTVAPLANTGRLPAITIGPSKGVQTKLDRATARRIAADLVSDLRIQSSALSRRDAAALGGTATYTRLPELRREIERAGTRPIDVPVYRLDAMHVWLEPGQDQGAAIAVAALQGSEQLSTFSGTRPRLVRRQPAVDFRQTLELQQDGPRWLVARVRRPSRTAAARLPSPATRRAATAAFAGVRLADVAKQVGLDFQQGAFRFGVTPDPPAMMGGGLCWLDYDNDGWVDLFVVNSFAESDLGTYDRHGGLPRSALFHNDRGRFAEVTARSGAGLAVRGEGCVAADLDGDGYTDLFVSTASDDQLLWNDGDGTFTQGARSSGVVSYGWHSGAAVGDVDGDGRPDLFVAGYTEVNGAIPGSSAGYPTNHLGVRDLLFLNAGNGPDGHARFREIGRRAGLDRPPYDHSLGAVFTDLNGDGRLDLYVANDEDPNRAYLNVAAPGLGFRFVDRATALGIADRSAGMGIAGADFSGDGRPDLFVTNSRGQTHAAFRNLGGVYADARPALAGAFGTNFTGWGDSWVDLNNDGSLDLVLANGDIPVRNLAKDAGRIQVLGNAGGRFVDVGDLLGVQSLPRTNGRGVAAADFDNDGHVDLAVNSVGGRLILLRSTGGAAHWLEVKLPRFAPGAIVTAVLPDGRRLVREVQAGSSYLSSEDPRVHFGLGSATRVRELVVRYPDGHATRLRNVPADRILDAPPS